MRLLPLLLAACTATPPADDAPETDPPGGDTAPPASPGRNRPPRGEARVDPAAPTSADVLACVVDGLRDPDGDEVTVTFAWTVDGRPAGAGATLGPVARGHAVACTATLDDGTVTTTRDAVPVRIENGAPTWSPRLTPAVPTRARPPTLGLDDLHDPDADPLSVLVAWTVDGEEVGGGLALDPRHFVRGSTVEARVAALDGLAWTGALTLPPVVVGNAPPEVGVTLDRPRVRPGDRLVALVHPGDADDDPLDVRVAWWAGGARLAADGPALVVPELPVGTSLVAEVTVDDGLDAATTRSPVALVVATEDEARHVALTPDDPHQRHDLRCDAGPDAPAPALTWTVDGAPVDPADLRAHALPHDTVPWQRTRGGEVWACTATWEDGAARRAEVTIRQGPLGGNVLLVIADDLGVDKVGAYAMHPSPPPTPRIDALAAEGVRFTSAFAYHACSPSRAALLTGRHARRTGIGRTVELGDAYVLSFAEVGLARALRHSPAYAYTSAAVGKWHVGSLAVPAGRLHPEALGFDTFAVSMGNPGSSSTPGTRRRDYFDWEKNTDGVLSDRRTYMTTDQVDDALALTRALPEPWFVWLAFNAPHEPMHAPPAHLHTQRLGPLSTDREKYDAMVEALDTELGRLLDGMDPDVLADTTVIVVGDNGTPAQATTAPFLPNRAKTTLFEGGVHVPLIVAGPHVRHRGSVADALVHVVDVFATVADLAGVPLDTAFASGGRPGTLAPWPIDGISLLPQLADPATPGRDVILLEKFAPNGRAAPRVEDQLGLRDPRWRYLVDASGRELVFDLAPQRWVHDGQDLLATPSPEPDALDARDRLAARLQEVLDALDARP